jgi:hypothetical protein
VDKIRGTSEADMEQVKKTELKELLDEIIGKYF